jgi:glutaredoxin 2
MSTFNPFDPFNDEEFEFEIVEEVDQQEVHDTVQTAYKKQMQALEKLIVPLLKNLMKNPDVETIKWPNRAEAVKAQLAKITTITKSKLEY